MTIDRLRNVLSAVGPPPDARELSEMLWLACHISPSEEPAPSAPPVPPPVPDERADDPGGPRPPEPAPPRPSEPLTELRPRPGADAEPVGRASEVLVPTAPMLADPLGVQRALRPLKRRVPSRHRVELDEDATAARIADTRLWTPVLVPSPERWLGLSLVVDTGPTMRLWRPLARELAETLLRQGAFQDVHLGYLDGNGRVASTPEAPPQDPGTLLDASGRRAVLVLSDCSGPHWWNGRAGQAVRRWAQAGPTAIVQPLAERLWRRTAAPASPGLAVLPRPGAPNTDLRFAPYDGAAAPGVPVPVLEIAPRWFGAWARLVSGSEPQPAAVATLPARPSGTAPVRRERELPIAERVRRFLATASPGAAELAAHVAVSVPSLPVMRLIQHRILGGSGPGQLAEVLLSGLLRPADGVRYAFVPGAREALLDTLPRPEALHTRHVLEAVSAEIERRAGTSAETFRALLPADGGPVVLTADTDHFALLTPRTRSHLVSTPTPTPPAPDLLELLDTPVEELIGEGWDRGPRPTVIGVDGDDLVTVDVLHGNPDLPHGLITGPRAFRDALLRTLVMGLALNHSPNILNFAFVDHSRGLSFVNLNLPHIATSLNVGSADAPLLGGLPEVLETERRRREAMLQAAGVTTWDEYQAAIAAGRPLGPLPALVVIIDETGPLIEARPELVEPLAALCEAGPSQGIKFVFCSSNESLTPPELSGYAGWNVGFPSRMGDHLASVHIFAQEARPAFEPARISLDTADAINALMRRRGPQARRLPWPEDPPSSEPVARVSSVELAVEPGFDVLWLNGGGPNGMLHETWDLPAEMPRSPAIGYRPGGHLLNLYPLDSSSGIPHGLIVGGPEARQKVVRAITLALAAGHSPADLRFVFAGMGEHPLGEPIDLPHVRYSEEELLGSPERLRRFFEFLSGELEARSASPPQDTPHVSDPGTGQWTVDELYEQFRQDPNSVDRVWWNFFEDYQPGEQPAALPPGSPSTPPPQTRPRLLVVADLSLTFPISRPEVGETLLSLAQRGRALDVQLLLTASTVENTTIWGRFLPLLGWRIAAGRLPPDQLRHVLGQASLQFPDGERTAYLLAGGGSPQQFTVAPEPPRDAVDDFVRRTRTPSQGSSASTTPEGPLPEDIDRLLTNLQEKIGNDPRIIEGESVDFSTVEAALREMLQAVAESARSGASRPIRHLMFSAPLRPEMEVTASLFGEMLIDLGMLPSGDANVLTVSYTQPDSGPDPAAHITASLRSVRSTVFLIGDAPEQGPETGYLNPDTIRSLLSLMRYERDGSLVILCGEPERFEQLLQTIPEFAERFRWVHAFDAETAPPRAPVSRNRRVRLGSDPETGEAVHLDFDVDRHLLISGPSGSGKATLVRKIVDGLASSGTERDRLVYFLDMHMSPHDLARAEAWGRVGVRHTSSPEEFGRMLTEARWSTSTRLLRRRGPSIFLVVSHRPRLLGDDPLAAAIPDLRTMREHGVHLVLARHQITFGESLDPVVTLLRDLGAPALLTRYVGGHEARLWDVPSSLQGPLEPGDALLVHPGRQRLVRLGDPAG